MKKFCLVLIAVLAMQAVCIAHPEDMPKKAEGEAVKAGQFVLKNPRLTVEVMKPGDEKAAYAGSRFEWGATVLQVTLDGKHTFCSAENPGSRFHGYGLAEEMGIGGPVGFKQENNKQFLKIGVGIFKTNGFPYNFGATYKTARKLDWKVEVNAEKTKATFVQVLKDFEGWGYRYEKRIVLDPKLAQMKLEHVLENTGTKPIKTDQYCHHFMIFDKQRTGPDYVATFPFKTKLSQPNTLVVAKGNDITWKKPVEGGSYYAIIEGYAAKAEDNEFVLRHKPSGLAVRISGDFALSRLPLWGRPDNICFEPFIAINLEPGKKMAWTRTYGFAKKGEEPPVAKAAKK
ncbi:MAG: hypothetical protein QF662_04070 [Phycisphaerae bacterium]|nr:hypothetical protein [Phycisphaerae bacterium]